MKTGRTRPAQRDSRRCGLAKPTAIFVSTSGSRSEVYRLLAKAPLRSLRGVALRRRGRVRSVTSVVEPRLAPRARRQACIGATPLLSGAPSPLRSARPAADALASDVGTVCRAFAWRAPNQDSPVGGPARMARPQAAWPTSRPRAKLLITIIISSLVAMAPPGRARLPT